MPADIATMKQLQFQAQHIAKLQADIAGRQLRINELRGQLDNAVQRIVAARRLAADWAVHFAGSPQYQQAAKELLATLNHE